MINTPPACCPLIQSLPNNQALKPSEFDSYSKAFQGRPITLRNELEAS